MAVIGTSPSAVLLDELKSYLRIEGVEEDALLMWLLRAATESVEAWLGWLLIERDVEERRTVCDGVVRLAASPAKTLVSAADAHGLPIEDAELTSTRFGVGQIAVPPGIEGSEIVVRYRAGLSKDWNGLPEPVRLGVLRAAAHFFAHRDAGDDGGIPPAVARLVAPWRWRRMH